MVVVAGVALVVEELSAAAFSAAESVTDNSLVLPIHLYIYISLGLQHVQL